MKLGIFTDPHYSSHEVTCYNRYNSQSLRKIKEAYAYFEEQKCDLIVCLGDLIDNEDTEDTVALRVAEIAPTVKACPIPTVCLVGNHDSHSINEDRFYSILGIEPPRDIETDGKLLVFMDGNYFTSGEHYSVGNSLWTDTFYPFEQELKDKIKAFDGEVFLFIHQNIDPAAEYRHRVANADSLFEFFNSCGKVNTVFQGHFHPGCRSEHNGVNYITLPAMCEREQAYFIFDI
ncbi:MAG: metallophosphoesterase [Clostridia bacterium]|nr:metallophosphoesterase [Clostridia bacterium]